MTGTIGKSLLLLFFRKEDFFFFFEKKKQKTFACLDPQHAVSAFYDGSVVHQRLRPVRHRLRYRVFYMLFDLDELPMLSARLRLFAHERFNLFSFHERDHGAGTPGGLRHWVHTCLEDAGLGDRCGAIRILCMPRILGHAFNPISVFFCHRPDGTLLAMIYEVRNTFGEKHCYLIPAQPAENQQIRQSCAKQFFVSPFMPMRLTYRFRVRPPGPSVSLAITASDEAGTLIATAFAGTRQNLSDRALLARFLATPLLGLKVLAAIHWEALKLWLRGLALLPRPAPPLHPVSTPL
jgi:DUF1365 family protein